MTNRLKAIKKIIFSPHFDDACLSAFNILDIESLVVTVFAGRPKVALHTKWDVACGFYDSTDAMTKRQNENLKAAKLIGFEFKNLQFLDWQYKKSNSHNKLHKEIEQIILQYQNVKFYVPLAWGAEKIHPDHSIVREIAYDVWKRYNYGELLFYADLPYVIGSNKLVWSSVKNKQGKWTVCNCYKSQLNNLIREFPSLNEDSLSMESILSIEEYEKLTT